MSRLSWRHGAWTCVVSLVGVVLPVWIASAEAPPLDRAGYASWEERSATPAALHAGLSHDEPVPVELLPTTDSIARDLTMPQEQRFYLTSIVGGSFLVVSADNAPASSLTAGGAMGMALERSNGRIRLEVEGRYRDVLEQTYLGFNENYPKHDPAPIGIMQARTYGGWSALVNVWRDFRFTEHVDLYGGGGIGAAGFQTELQRIDATDPGPKTDRYITGYAWQLGVGSIWNISDRIALDASYRIFGVGWTITKEDVSMGFLRSEILLSLRIYEPFRGLLR